MEWGLSTHHECVSTNAVALYMLKVLYLLVQEIGHFSDALDHVGKDSLYPKNLNMLY